MRLCRFLHDQRIQAGFYGEKFVVPLSAAAKAYAEATHEKLAIPDGDDLMAVLPPEGKSHAAAAKIASWVERQGDGLPAAARIATEKVELLVPVPRPNKLFLLAGNYADHIVE
ncbi:MAG: hypothetical protein WEH44_02680, partial [Pirellulaceae bacterium]